MMYRRIMLVTIARGSHRLLEIYLNSFESVFENNAWQKFQIKRNNNIWNVSASIEVTNWGAVLFKYVYVLYHLQLPHMMKC